MSEIGAISLLASSAAEPFATTPVTAAGTTPGDTGGGAAASIPGAFSADYAMSLLAKITHAGADQALTLIQAMLPPVELNQG
jgi:hypothetical protein